MEENSNDILHGGTVDFMLQSESPKIIKVIGVGGGGGNAVNYMFREGIDDVTFVLCNTDVQDLKKSAIPIKIQLGPKQCGGLGAGNDPQVAHDAAEESIEEIKQLFTDGTQMAFITAGMGGGTGTGAAPVVARVAKEMGMLTVGIVTIPFLFEKRPKILQALRGVEEMRKNVDALLVINDERLREIYTDGITSLEEGLAKANDILCIATKSIAEIITTEGTINLDFRDVKKVLKDGGVAIMSTGRAKGDKRLKRAIENALHSPLLNNNNITNAKKVLFNIYAGSDNPILIEEMSEIDSFMDSLNPNMEVIWGKATDDSLGEYVKFTILATGFGAAAVPGIDQLLSADERAKVEAREEQEAADTAKIDEYYGRQGNTKKYHKNKVYIFTDEDLENDAVIAMVEDAPTFTRDSARLNAIKEKSDETTGRDMRGDDATQPSADSGSDGQEAAIVF